MKRIIVSAIVAVIFAATASAQKFAMVDMDYVMKAIPAYETANEQLDQISKKWQKEIEAILTEVQTMYKNYQTELVFLSDEMKVKREEEIIAREKDADDLKRKYFAADGELFKKREALIKPIQDEVYNAIKELCEMNGYQLIIDKSSAMSVVYAAPKIDISDQLLEKLGYSAQK